MECDSISNTYPPVGRCIYCGAKPPEVTLTQEHIIPAGLKGYLKLPESSCDKCAALTSGIEHRVLREMLGPARIHLGFGFRRKEQQPDVLDGVFVGTDEELTPRKVSIVDHPFILAMPDFESPGILRGTANTAVYEKVRIWLYNFQGDTQDRVDRLGSKKVRLQQNLMMPEFFRMLAKIGHSFTCAVVGVDGFEPLLLDTIFGRNTKFAYLIGGADEHLKSPNSGKELLHNIWLDYAWKTEKKDDQPLLICPVQLFSCFNAPVYQIVVGRSFAIDPQPIQ